MDRHSGKSEVSITSPPAQLSVPASSSFSGRNTGLTAPNAMPCEGEWGGRWADGAQEDSVPGLQSAAATWSGAWSSVKRISLSWRGFQAAPAEARMLMSVDVSANMPSAENPPH